MSVSIPDLAAAEGVITHWIRAYSGQEAAGTPDNVSAAATDLVYKSIYAAGFPDDGGSGEAAFIANSSFGEGAAFGARVALAIVNAPLGGAEPAIEEAFNSAMLQMAGIASDVTGNRAMEARQIA